MTASVVVDGWREAEIGELNAAVTSGSRGWGRYYSEAGDLFIRITNLSRENINLDLSSSKFVRLPDDEREGLRTSVQNGDVLISITADIGIAGIVDDGVPKPAYINQHIASVRFPVGTADGRFVAYYLASKGPQKSFRAMTDTGAKAGMSLGTVRKIKFQCPPLAEQQRIASALKDIDDLIASLDALIAKKRDIKQAAMQQLLTGKTRLAGFEGEWVSQALGGLSKIKTGSKNNQDKSEDGDFPFFVRSATVERISTHSYDCEAILVPGEGGIGSIFHYVFGKFDAHQRVYVINDFNGIHGRFLYYQMAMSFGAYAMQNSVKATVDSLRLPTFQTFEVHMPVSIDEQKSIAGALDAFVGEISALDARRGKIVALKEGMMQQLLTGRIRLV